MTTKRPMQKKRRKKKKKRKRRRKKKGDDDDDDVAEEEGEIEARSEKEIDDIVSKISGNAPKFNYVSVPSNDFGLTTEDILNAEDKELNQFVSIKRLAPYREKDWKVPRQKKKEFLEKLRSRNKKGKSKTPSSSSSGGGRGKGDTKSKKDKRKRDDSDGPSKQKISKKRLDTYKNM